MEQFPSMFKTTEDRKEGKIDTTKTCFRQETFCSKGKEGTFPFANLAYLEPEALKPQFHGFLRCHRARA